MKARILGLLIYAVTAVGASAQIFHDMAEYPLLGTLAHDAERQYTRLPDSLQNLVKEDIWKLGQNTAGMSVRFATNASTITVKWTVLNKFSMNHMATTGVRGLDLYTLLPDDTWAYVGTAIPSSNDESTKNFVKGMTKQMREYLMFLPLYDGIEDLQIGVEKGAKITQPQVILPATEKPVIMYGTSILQGGCASRPGMAHTNILQRMLNREVINLGFSGNAHLEPEMAQFIAQADAGAYVIDVLPNNTIASLNQKLEPFYRILRDAHPTTPIVLVENPIYSRFDIDEGYRKGVVALNRTLRKFYEDRLREGDTNIYYFEGIDVMDEDAEGSVDGAHLTDLGFITFAKAMYPLLDTILSNSKK